MPQLKVKSLVEQYIFDNQEGFRYHLGASVIGRECERQIWYGWRWFKVINEEPRMLRLFKRGHKEENILNTLLLNSGVNVHELDPKTGKQWSFKHFGGHFAGSLDGILTNIPDLVGRVLAEFKTINANGHKQLIKNGVEKEKTEHYAQMQIYMHYFKLLYALYISVCKNDDSWHWEIVSYDGAVADKYINRAERIIASDKAPARMSSNPGYYKCKWCDYNDVCHYNAAPALNCRSCRHSWPSTDGRWNCKILPTYKIRTSKEARERKKPLVHIPCSGLRYQPIEEVSEE